MAVYRKPPQNDQEWAPAAKPAVPDLWDLASAAGKGGAALDGGAAHGDKGGEWANALYGCWGEGSKGGASATTSEATGSKNGGPEELQATAAKVAQDPAQAAKTDPNVAHQVMVAQMALAGAGGGGGAQKSAGGNGAMDSMATATQNLASLIPLMSGTPLMIPFIVQLMQELLKQQEAERRRLLTPDNAVERAKDDPTYAQRLALAQDLIKIGGHGKLEEGKYVVEELLKMPVESLQMLKDKDTKVVVCRDSVTDYMTELKGVQPRGWPPGSTWDTVPGLNSPGRNEVVIAIRGDGTPQGPHVPGTGDGHGSTNLVIHEVMHAVDLNNNKGKKAISETSEFTTARDGDATAIQNQSYLAQAGEAGRQETFAEVAARYYSGDPTLKTEMPQLYAYFAANPFAGKKPKAEEPAQTPN